MKKLLTIALALTLVLSLSVVAFANNTNTNGSWANEDDKTLVQYTLADSYVVTIPADVTLNDFGGAVVERTVTASDVSVGYDEEVQVTVTSANAWNIVDTKAGNADNKYAYTVKLGDSSDAITNGTEVLAVDVEDEETKGSGSVVMKFALSQAVIYSGNYLDTLTFVVNVGAK